MALTDKQKRDNFLKHGNRRLSNAVKSIKLLNNIANQRYYGYEEKEKNLIFKKLEEAIREVKNSFNRAKSKKNKNNDFLNKMKNNKYSNQEIVTIAVYILGSGIGTFDIETIAKQADEIALDVLDGKRTLI